MKASREFSPIIFDSSRPRSSPTRVYLWIRLLTQPPFSRKRDLHGSTFDLQMALEDSGLIYRIVGDPVARLLGSQVLVGGLSLAISDEQLEDARSILLKNSFTAIEQKSLYYDGKCEENKSGWLGYAFTPTDLESPSVTTIMLVPANSWYLDLSPSNFLTSTVLLGDTRYRFPTRLSYTDGEIREVYFSPRNELSVYHGNRSPCSAY